MQDRIKIVHILNSVGGVDVALRLILENIDGKKFESFVIHGFSDTDKPYLDIKGSKIKDFKVPIKRNINFFRDIKAIYQARNIIREINPCLIHAHSAKGGVIGKIIGAQLKIPVLYTPHAYSFLSTQNIFKKKFFLIVEQIFRSSNNKILATSKSESKRAIQDVGYKPEKVLLFNNSINPITQFKKPITEKIWPNNYICSVGRPSYQKNIELMLDVLAKVKETYSDIHLVLMGIGYHSPNLEGVKRKIKELSLQKNITLLEWVTREEIFYVIKNSKLYLSTSRYEGLPYSIIESLALGKAIVATDADGNRDLVKNNYNGYLIFDENVDQLSIAVIDILNSEVKKNTFSENSLKLFQNKFNIVKNINSLEEIYISNSKK